MGRRLHTSWSPKPCSFCEKKFIFNDHHLKPLTENDEIAPSCEKCHIDIHRLFTNEELDGKFNNVESLKKELEARRKNYERKIQNK
jgi:hypothetical protein